MIRGDGMPENKKRPGARTSSTPNDRSVKKSNPSVEKSAPDTPLRIEAPPRVRAAKNATSAPKAPAGKRSAESSSRPLSILMVASEAHPYAKTGGLAEVAAALPDALGRLGHRVTLVLPRYRGVDLSASRSQAATM